MPAPEVSLVIPAFQEARRLPASLRRVAEFCEDAPWPCEAIVVVENSRDGTLELARSAITGRTCVQVVDNQVHRGKGYAVRSGVLRAGGAIIFYMDADLSTPLEEVARFVEFFAVHPEVDVLAGNRQHAASRIVRRQTRLREAMGQTFNVLLRLLAPVQMRDTQCGFKAFRREAACEIFSRQKLDGFSFDVEVLLLAERLGFNVADLPVQWSNSPDSKVRIVRDSFKMLGDAVRVRRLVERTLREMPRAGGGDSESCVNQPGGLR